MEDSRGEGLSTSAAAKKTKREQTPAACESCRKFNVKMYLFCSHLLVKTMLELITPLSVTDASLAVIVRVAAYNA